MKTATLVTEYARREACHWLGTHPPERYTRHTPGLGPGGAGKNASSIAVPQKITNLD